MIVLLLVVAASISFVVGHMVEGLSVIAVLVVNTFIGFFTELRAVRSMEALKKMGVTTTTVLRNSIPKKVNSRDLVPGDILIFEAGDIISADSRIIESANIAADESILTGESFPSNKFTEAIIGEAIITEMSNMLFRGTSLTRGSGKGIVVAIGMNTEIGRIARVTEQASDDLTPLEKKLEKLAQQLVFVCLIIAVLIAVSGIVSGKSFILMLETAIALAVATIPEGLPIVATLALAKGMWRMARKNTLVNKLSAVAAFVPGAFLH